MTLETGVKCRGSQEMTEHCGPLTMRSGNSRQGRAAREIQSPSSQSDWPASVVGDGLAFTPSRFTAPAVWSRDADCRVPSYAVYKRRYMRSTARCINQARRMRNSRLALATE